MADDTASVYIHILYSLTRHLDRHWHCSVLISLTDEPRHRRSHRTCLQASCWTGFDENRTWRSAILKWENLITHNPMRYTVAGSQYISLHAHAYLYSSQIDTLGTTHGYCNLYVTSCDDVTYVPAVPALKFQKSWLRTLGYRQKIHHFFFSHTWATRFKYLPEGCPYMLMYSALHIMQWFSGCLDVFTPKIRRKFFDFNIFMNQNKRRLHKTWNDR